MLQPFSLKIPDAQKTPQRLGRCGVLFLRFARTRLAAREGPAPVAPKEEQEDYRKQDKRRSLGCYRRRNGLNVLSRVHEGGGFRKRFSCRDVSTPSAMLSMNAPKARAKFSTIATFSANACNRT
jgi:hypothetical protein